MDEDSTRAAAETLWELWTSGGHLDELPLDQRPQDLDDAWAIQRALDALAGPRIGWKLASTSAQGQAVIGIDHPLIGVLYERQLAPNRGSVAVTNIRVAEAEFAFRIRGALDPGHAPFSREHVLAHVAGVYAGMEVPDVRIGDYPRVRAPELVADFMAAGHYAVGDEMHGLDLADVPAMDVVVLRNGVAESRGTGADVLGDPCEALVWLANQLAARGEGFRDGELITTGACAFVDAVQPGDLVKGVFGDRYEVELSFVAV